MDSSHASGLINGHTIRFLVLGLTIFVLKKLIMWAVRRWQRSRRAMYRVAIAGGVLLLSVGELRAQATPTPGPPTPTPYTVEGAHSDDVLQRKAILFVLSLIFGGMTYTVVQRRVRL